MAAFDASGRGRFYGGLTAARGSGEGPAGADAVADVLRGREPSASEAPAFGCPLAPPTSR